MIVDTSGLVAIIKGESEGRLFLETMLAVEAVKLSAATYFECGMVIDRIDRGQAGIKVDRLLSRVDAEIIPVTLAHARIARAAYSQFGKGRHPARLNFGDCFAYALARETGEPLLYKGDDFALTDVEAAV